MCVQCSVFSLLSSLLDLSHDHNVHLMTTFYRPPATADPKLPARGNCQSNARWRLSLGPSGHGHWGRNRFGDRSSVWARVGTYLVYLWWDALVWHKNMKYRVRQVSSVQVQSQIEAMRGPGPIIFCGPHHEGCLYPLGRGLCHVPIFFIFDIKMVGFCAFCAVLFTIDVYFTHCGLAQLVATLVRSTKLLYAGPG